MPSHLTGERARALKLLEIYHGGVDDFFKFWPSDKTYFFSTDNKAFMAYRVHNHAAVCLGDPVGHKDSIVLLLKEFKAFCSEHNWLLIFIQTDHRYYTQYASIGLRPLLIGSDAAINLDRFMRHTVHNSYFRNIVNRFEKNHFEVETLMPPHSKQVLRDVQSISDSWLKLPNRKEWSFITGRADNDYLQQLPLFILKDSEGMGQAFISQLPSYEHGAASIDLMRHRATSPPNSMDYLLICFMRKLHASGYAKFNLGMSPLDSKPRREERLARLLKHIYSSYDRFIGFRGLHQFKSKYQPDWEARYVWYQGPFYHLPRYARAVYKLMK